MTVEKQNVRSSRRDFLKQSGAVAGGLAFASAVPYVHAAEDNTIKFALIGCGGRGGGAALQALKTSSGPTKLVALCDVFESRSKGLLKRLKTALADDPEKFADNVPVFGLPDGYKHAIDAVGPGGAVLLATAPLFRPLHVEYAVQKGVNVFMEKSCGVDGPGIRRLLAANEVAKKKNLKIVTGLNQRYHPPLQQAIEQLHNGIIGERITCWAFRMQESVRFNPRREVDTIVGHQILNYSCFKWLNGTCFLDWLIHNLDVCCWAKGAYPIAAQGHGGRQVRTANDTLFDHYAVEYTFEDGTKMFAQRRGQDNTWQHFQSTIHCEKGCAVIGEGVPKPMIFKGHNPVAENVIWQYTGGPVTNSYQFEQDTLFDSIRNDKPVNNADYGAKSSLVGILGRMAAETGQYITWNEALNSTHELAPNHESLTLDSPSPMMPDENGNYDIAKPGITQYT